LCTILRAQTGNDRDAFVPFLKVPTGVPLIAAATIGYVSVRDAYQVRAIRINLIFTCRLSAPNHPSAPQLQVTVEHIPLPCEAMVRTLYVLAFRSRSASA